MCIKVAYFFLIVVVVAEIFELYQVVFGLLLTLCPFLGTNA